MGLLTGQQLDAYVQQYMNPFCSENGIVSLKPASDRFSILSNNANHPLWEEQAKGILLAHADTNHSTVGGIALSFNSCIKGGASSSTEGIVEGARMSHDNLLVWAKSYNLNSVALLVDHFTGPERSDALKTSQDSNPHISRVEARERIVAALDFLIDANLDHIERWGKVVGKDDKGKDVIEWNETDYDFRKSALESVRRDGNALEESVALYLSKSFQDFRRQCIGVAQVIPRAASFMVELGAYRPW